MTTILVIEDDPDIRDIISEILEAIDFQVFQADNGAIGVQLAQAHLPDLILCDISMAELDGFGVLSALRQSPSTATIPFIFLTARVDRADIRQGMQLGADDYITKPFSRNELLSAIKIRLEKRALLASASLPAPPAVIPQTPAPQPFQRALNNSEFILHYQPQVDLVSNQMVGAEALIRWYCPERGMVPPDLFIPLAEESGWIIPIEEWVLRTACTQAKRWQSLGSTPLQITVNLSSLQFNQPDLLTKIQGVLTETGIDPTFLKLELTERLLVQNVETTITRFSQLKELGIQISIDDFGKGYASLSYLQHFPFDTLKIDRCFVQNVDQNSKNAAITTALIQMAHQLGLEVVAEGVETEAERQFLLQHGCDAMQGYLFSPAIPPPDFERLLRQMLSTV